MTDLDRSPFDPGLDEMRQMGADVVDLATRFIDERYTAPAADYSDLEPLLAALSKPPPSAGAGLAELLGQVETAAGKGFDPANPGFAAYIPGGGCTRLHWPTSWPAVSTVTRGSLSLLPHWCRSRRVCCAGCATCSGCRADRRVC